jgi:hypothetical protein
MLTRSGAPRKKEKYKVGWPFLSKKTHKCKIENGSGGQIGKA